MRLPVILLQMSVNIIWKDDNPNPTKLCTTQFHRVQKLMLWPTTSSRSSWQQHQNRIGTEITTNSEAWENKIDRFSANTALHSKLFGRDYKIPPLRDWDAAAATTRQNTKGGTEHTYLMEKSLQLGTLNIPHIYLFPFRVARHGTEAYKKVARAFSVTSTLEWFLEQSRNTEQ